MASKERIGGKQASGVSARGGLRAFRKDDVSAQIERRLWMLGLGVEALKAGGADTRLEHRLARALRRERRAARAGGIGYDPVRHLVLARLERRRRR